MLPSAMISSRGKRSRKALSTDKPADRSDLLGIRLLNKPRRGLNECHGNAFHSTNSSGFRPSLSNELQTIVAVGSEKPSGHCSGLLVRFALTLEKAYSGFYSNIFLFSQQDSLGGHWDSAEMAAAITERFTDHNDFCLAEPLRR